MCLENFVVYTAIENGYDFLKTVPRSLRSANFVCFSNTLPAGEKNGWTIVQNPLKSSDATTLCRYVKVNAHKLFPRHSASVWVDGSIILTEKFESFVGSFMKSKSDLHVIPHAIRDCIYDEGEACVRVKKESKANWARLKEVLVSENYPVNAGLIESGVMCRRHNEPSIVALMDMWWNMIETFSRRDQLSFNFCAWKLGVPYEYIEHSVRGGHPAFFAQKHKTGTIKDYHLWAEARSEGGGINLLWKAQTLFLKRLKKISREL